MKAILCTKYGPPDVLKLADVKKPDPRDNEVRIKVYAAPVTTADVRIRSFRSPVLFWLPMRFILGITKPRKPVLGVELAGEVEAIGKKVTRFKKGDQVFAFTGLRFGAYAEYACLPEDGLVALKPANATYEEAAATLFGGTTALHFLRKGKIGTGQKVLVYGASGAVGTSAVQLARHFGAQVTGVCSGANIALVKSLGADRVIDYTKDDFTRSGMRYDIVFDAVGKMTKSAGRSLLAPGGTFVSVEGDGVSKERIEDVMLLGELMETGKLRAVIDRCYPLEQIVEAHRYVDKGRKKGSVIITVARE